MLSSQVATLFLFFKLKSFFEAGGPPYPPNQYGGGRGNYDNFRGQGEYLGKPRNIRWDRCTCLYFATNIFFFLLMWKFETPFKRSFLLFFCLHCHPLQNVTRWPTQHHWVPWPGCTRWYGLLLEGSHFLLFTSVVFCLLFGVMRLFLFLKGLFCNYCATRTAVNRFINKVVIKLQ